MTCPKSGRRYRRVEPGVVRYLDLDEETPLPEVQWVEEFSYGESKWP